MFNGTSTMNQLDKIVDVTGNISRDQCCCMFQSYLQSVAAQDWTQRVFCLSVT